MSKYRFKTVPCMLAATAVTGALAFAAFPMTAVAAENYPDRTITIMVPYPPGGFTDQVGRLTADGLSERLGETVVVDNRPGGGTVVGQSRVASATPDGYNLGIAPFAFAVNPGLFDDLPYDTENDFTHIATLGTAFNVMVAYPGFEPNTVEELVEYAKANPGAVNCGSAGVGSSPHLACEMFSALAGIEWEHIPYAGSAPSRVDLEAGRIEIIIDNYSNVKPLVDDGRAKALGVTLTEESELMPGVPPISDVVEGYEVLTWWGLYAPAGVPDEIVAKLNEAVNDTLQSEEVLQAFDREGVTPVTGTPEEAREFVQNQMQTWIPIAEDIDMDAY